MTLTELMKNQNINESRYYNRVIMEKAQKLVDLYPQGVDRSAQSKFERDVEELAKEVFEEIFRKDIDSIMEALTKQYLSSTENI